MERKKQFMQKDKAERRKQLERMIDESFERYDEVFKALAEGYKGMATDREREAETTEWIEGTITDNNIP